MWRCCTRVEHGPGACNADAIHESELQNLVVRAINMALGQKDTMYDVLQRNVEAVLTGTDGISLDEIDARLEELQKELLNVANAKGVYSTMKLPKKSVRIPHFQQGNFSINCGTY